MFFFKIRFDTMAYEQKRIYSFFFFSGKVWLDVKLNQNIQRLSGFSIIIFLQNMVGPIPKQAKIRMKKTTLFKINLKLFP